MARRIDSRLRIFGVVHAETPLHVGGFGIDVDTDLPLARNGKGDLYVPGTGITGVMRSWCETSFDKSIVKEVFGFQEGDDGHASFILIEDAVVTLPDKLQTEIRDGVGIDRFYGTAADRAKYDRAILPKGTTLSFEMTVEIGKDGGGTKAVIGHLLAALTNGEIRFGASKTRGLGRIKLDLNEILEEKLLSFDDILSLFDDTKRRILSVKDLIDTDKNTSPKPDKPRLEITIRWKPRLPLMVKAGHEGIGVDMLPLTSGSGEGNVSLCLPGSSIKGAFRAQAERILRTLLDCEATNDRYKTKGIDVHEQIRLELIDELFGAKMEPPKNNESEDQKKRKMRLGLGALSIDDCYFGKQFDAADWRVIESGRKTMRVNDREVEVTYTEQELWKALKKIDGNADLSSPTKEFSILHHVAIDRWTGGASEGALYSVLQPTARIGWQQICLTLDLSRLPGRSLEKRCLMLLLLVLRDFSENRLPLGFATNRGMGEVIVEKITGLDPIPSLLGLQGESFEAEIKDEHLIFHGDGVKRILEEVWSYE